MEKQDLTKDQKIARQSSELRALREKQIAEATGGAEKEMVTANRNPKFQIPALEAEGYVHVFTRVKNLSNDQKSFINDDRIVAIHAREFDRRVKDGAFATYDEVEVIHDPRKGAPASYALKPVQLDVNGPVKSSASQPSAQDIERTKQQIEKEAKRIDAKNDALKDKEADIAAREAALAAREKALADAEAKPATAPAAPSAPVVAEIKAEPSATAATPDPKADKAKK